MQGNKYNELLIHSKLPSYLTEFMDIENDVLFVSAIKHDTINITQTNIETSVCNLTGNPLQVDLSILPSNITTSGSIETKEEKYVPITLDKAREFINDYNDSNIEDRERKAIVCLCDGKDDMHTVLLGYSLTDGNFIRMMAFSEECRTGTDLKNNFNALLDYHVQNVGVGTHKVDTQVMCLYDLYGYKLSEYHLNEYCEHIGSVQVEGVWNLLQPNIPEHGAMMKLMLQVVVGHEDSVIYYLYQELQFLRYCLDELANNKEIGDTHLAHQPKDILDLYENINDILHRRQVIKLPVAPQDNTFNYRKETNFSDELWNILKNCRTVNDLSKCFEKLFEIIANEPLKIQMLEDDLSHMFGRVIQDICSGRMAIPYLSAKQCFELFTELGLQQLKKNYFTIIKSFNFQLAKDVQNKWNTLPALAHQTGRSTISGLNVSHGNIQACFLLQIHTAIEFLPLINERCRFSQGILMTVLKSVFNKYVMNTSLESFNDNLRQLCDITVPICLTDIKDNVLLSDCVPNKWKIKMSSNLKNSSAYTLFYCTRKPILCSPSYKCDDNNSTITEDLKFFVTRLETYSDKVC